MITFEAMKPTERETCAELAAKSFFDYEYFTNYVPDDKRRWRFLRTMLSIEMKINDGPAHFFRLRRMAESSRWPCSVIRITVSHRMARTLRRDFSNAIFMAACEM